MSKAIKYKVEIIDRNTSYVKALSELHAICFRGKGKEYWNDQSFRVLLGAKGTIGFSATADDCSLLGFVIGRSVMDESEVLTLCVLPTARRNGVAKNLMLKLIKRLSPSKRILLEVATSNDPALALYESLGFKQSGRRPAYYKKGTSRIDALILEL
ncbi:MAG: hypothetical protein CFH42_00998 [Alphaproteobacteria bacterium MarineAlpha12_Bin1]|nr:MAG: hypothetical protein CFH42_00998 [Alphaproteobacteria bacterium MarineAlpha12_Bin1]